MGSAASTKFDRKEAVDFFKEAAQWYGKGDFNRTDEEIDHYLIEKGVADVFARFVEDRDGSNLKDDDVRSATPAPPAGASGKAKSSKSSMLQRTMSMCVEHFDDSLFYRSWLSEEEADALFNHLKEVGEKQRPRNKAGEPTTMKYPLWTIYYGTKRAKDGAIALDRWGSYHESWIRVEGPSEELEKCCEKLRKTLKLPPHFINSVVVNYYFDGDTTYIPAHRDTVACLDDGSTVNCLSLGATRSFALTSNDDAGRYKREDLQIAREWRVEHGDMFVLGPRTNEKYCHVVPLEPGLTNMRISVIFRTISKSFVDLHGPEKEAVYASGRKKTFTAVCIKTTGFDDEGVREHVADLITEREREKLEKMQQIKEESKDAHDTADETKGPDGGSPSKTLKLLALEEDHKYYLGKGTTVLTTE